MRLTSDSKGSLSAENSPEVPSIITDRVELLLLSSKRRVTNGNVCL